MTSPDQSHIPIRMRARVDEIDAITDAITADNLNEEYSTLCRRMSAALAWKRPSPLKKGDAETWAAAIVHAVGWVNFLTDPAQQPHMTTAELAKVSGVGKGALTKHSRKVRDELELFQFHPEWTLPSKLADNPLVWMIEIDGLMMDLRHAPRMIQEEAFRQGLIPFVPGPDGAPVDLEDDDDSEDFSFFDDIEDLPSDGQRFRTELAGDTAGFRQTIQELVDGALGGFADPPSIDDLNRVLGEATADYNNQPQADLGGLSPTEVRRLLGADWKSPTSAVQLNDPLPLDELASSRTLDDARLLLGMMGEQGTVKATSKGNLPRAFVAAFRDRMRPRGNRFDERDHGREGPPRLLNEHDVFTLHIIRLLLELAGLIKRQKGVFSRTRRGEELTDAGRAGELFNTILRSHFKQLNLGYLDRAPEASSFQYTIDCTFYQFGRSGSDWKKADELVTALVLPDVVEELPADRYGDLPAHILEMRFLAPLEGFGLAESRELAREPGRVIADREWRKAPLFERVMRFEIGGGG